MSILEKDIEQQFLRFCKTNGYKCIKFRDPTKKGAPDRIVLLPGGRVVFIEFKRPGRGVISKHQTRYIGELQVLGFDVLVTDSYLSALNFVKAALK